MEVAFNMNIKSNKRRSSKESVSTAKRTSIRANSHNITKRKCKDVEVYETSVSVPPAVDVVIITALRTELCAILSLGVIATSKEVLCPDSIPAVDYWTEYKDSTDHPYFVREFVHTTGLTFRVAVAEGEAMGLAAATWRATSLVRELKPRCLAMTGICAGKRGEVNLGDVIVANKVFQYDYGKLVASKRTGVFHSHEIFHDITTYNLDTRWRDYVLDFYPGSELVNNIGQDRPRSLEEQSNDLLAEILENGPIEKDKCIESEKKYPLWTGIVERLIKQGLVEISSDDQLLALSAAGRAKAIKIKMLYPNDCTVEPFRVHLGPIGTGNQVIQDPEIFSRIQKYGRSTLGIEMEAFSIGLVANAERVPYMIIAKGVSDFADNEKDGVFQHFASITSAKFLLYFLHNHLPPKRSEIIVSEDASTSTVVRTQRIIYALREAKDRSNLLIRQVASFSSLTIDDQESHSSPEYHRLLLEERDEMKSLLNDGCTVRCIVSPRELEPQGNLTKKLYDSHKEKWKLRMINLKDLLNPKANTVQMKWKLEIVYSDALPNHNLLIIGDHILFEGRKFDSSSGFPCTMVSTQKDRLSFEMKYFDQLFESVLAKYGNGSNRQDNIDAGKKYLLELIERILN